MTPAKALIFPIILMLSLSVVGVGIAHWEDTLYIEGEVDTGTLCLELTESSHCYEYPEALGKDVGSCTTTLLDTDGDGYYDTMDVLIMNAYPCYKVDIVAWVHNCGTIPLHINSAIISDDDEEYVLTSNATVYLDSNGDGDADLEIVFGNGFGSQLHPCDSHEISMTLHVLQPMPQGYTAHFQVQIVAWQWNA